MPGNGVARSTSVPPHRCGPRRRCGPARRRRGHAGVPATGRHAGAAARSMAANAWFRSSVATPGRDRRGRGRRPPRPPRHQGVRLLDRLAGDRGARDGLGRRHRRQAGHAGAERQQQRHAGHAQHAEAPAATLLHRRGAQDLARVLRPAARHEGEQEVEGVEDRLAHRPLQPVDGVAHPMQEAPDGIGQRHRALVRQPGQGSAGRTGSSWRVVAVAGSSMISMARIPSEPDPPRIWKSRSTCSTAADGRRVAARASARPRPPPGPGCG